MSEDYCTHGIKRAACSVCGAVADEVARLRARLSEAEALLREAVERSHYCGWCGKDLALSHTTDCRLAAFLRGGKGNR